MKLERKTRPWDGERLDSLCYYLAARICRHKPFFDVRLSQKAYEQALQKLSEISPTEYWIEDDD